jgi:predicted ATPase/DNA-binding SARP family transcriptional activator
MWFGVLGPLEVVDDLGGRRDPAARRQRRLLLALLVWRDEAISGDRLADIVWADDPPPHDPIRSLRTYVTRLRTALGPGRDGAHEPMLLTTSTGYVLRLDGHEVDADRFARYVDDATLASERDPAAAACALDEALALWRGPALFEVAAEHWAAPEAARLEELRRTATEQRFRCLIELGRAADAIPDLERYVRQHPLREEPCRQLMLALARSGRTVEATQHYLAFRDRVREEAGLDPTDDLRALHQRLVGGRPPTAAHGRDRTLADVAADPAGAAAVPAPASAPRGRGFAGPPAPRTSFVGRDDDLAALAQLLTEVRLVTLTGIGGGGKTRLASELARREGPRFPGGVCYVSLATLSDPQLVARRLADAGGVADQGDGGGDRAREDELVTRLRERPPLLLIDNAEHLLDQVAAQVERLLERCPELTVLVTSREPLRIDGEHRWPVGPLASTAPDGADPPALRLLLDRTRELRPDLVVGAEDRDTLVRICRGLDGIPLALELASGRLAHLAPAQVAARLGDHLRASTGGPRREARHRTLYATMRWSYDLLTEAEQALLRDLAVFAGPVPLDVVVSVCRPGSDHPETVDVLGSLVAKSLVVADLDGPRTSYRLLETVRLFAEDAAAGAGETLELRDRHRDHHLAWLERFPWDHRVASPIVAAAGSDCHDDLRRGLDHSRSQGRWSLMARQLQAMSALFCVRGHMEEGGRWYAAVDTAALTPAEAAGLAVHRRLLEVYISLGSGEAYAPILAEMTSAVEVLDDQRVVALAHALVSACHIALTQDPNAVIHHAEVAMGHALARDAPQVAGFAATMACAGHLIRGDPEAAVEATEHVVGAPGWDDRHDGLRARAHLAAARHLAGDQRGAIEDARAALWQLGEVWHHDALGTLVLAHAAQGDLRTAHRLFAELLDGLESAGARARIQREDAVIVAGALAVLEGDLARACRLLSLMRWATNPTTFGVYLTYRRRLVERMPPGERHAIMAASRGLDLLEQLGRERDRLDHRRIVADT